MAAGIFQPETVAASADWTLWRRWVVSVTIGEVVGFAAPAFTGGVAYAAGMPNFYLWLALLGAGIVEGAVLGYAQWRVLHKALLAMPASHWVLATSVSAAVAWSLGMAPSTLFGDASPVVFIPAQVLGATGVLLTIGVGQWFVLREYVRRAGLWIPATAVAWMLAIPWVFVEMAVPAEEEIGLSISLALGFGLLMAMTVALFSGAALIWLLNHGGPYGPAERRELRQTKVQ